MEQLRVLRERKELSQAKLAARVGMNPATIWRIETGQRSPTIEQLERLAEGLDADITDFFPKAQAPLFPHEQAEESRRPEAIIDELHEWRQTAAHVQEWARVDRTELLDAEELPRGWQRGAFGARAVHDNVGRLSREAEDFLGLDKNMPRELSEAVAEAKSAANATLAEALQFFDAAEEVANRAGVREEANVRDLLSLLPGGRAA